jgi:hypothetical protein
MFKLVTPLGTYIIPDLSDRYIIRIDFTEEAKETLPQSIKALEQKHADALYNFTYIGEEEVNTHFDAKTLLRFYARNGRYAFLPVAGSELKRQLLVKFCEGPADGEFLTIENPPDHIVVPVLEADSYTQQLYKRFNRNDGGIVYYRFQET